MPYLEKNIITILPFCIASSLKISSTCSCPDLETGNNNK